LHLTVNFYTGGRGEGFGFWVAWQLETMAEASAMEIDEPQPRKPSAVQKGKGKSGPSAGQMLKGGPWVEKYRPTSLADVAAHKDIIDTSTLLSFPTPCYCGVHCFSIRIIEEKE
jgi:hypothetical protein